MKQFFSVEEIDEKDEIEEIDAIEEAVPDQTNGTGIASDAQVFSGEKLVSLVQALKCLSCPLPVCRRDETAFGPGNAGPFPYALPQAAFSVPRILHLELHVLFLSVLLTIGGEGGRGRGK